MSTEDIQALIDKAKESLEVAQGILQSGHEGFAVSRAYATRGGQARDVQGRAKAIV
jgi:uncharacterized protein (UPF0332 family)